MPQRHRRIDDRLPAEAIADRVDGVVGARAFAPLGRARAKASSASPNGSSSCSVDAAQMRHGNRQERDRRSPPDGRASTPVHQLDGDLGERRSVAEIGAGSVSARVTERISAKRTRTVTVRPRRDPWRAGVRRCGRRDARAPAGTTRSAAGSRPKRRLRAGGMRAPCAFRSRADRDSR